MQLEYAFIIEYIILLIIIRSHIFMLLKALGRVFGIWFGRAAGNAIVELVFVDDEV